jgi:Flp pilus assembly pilin Flp
MTNATHNTILAMLPIRVRVTARRFAVDSGGATAIEYALMTFIAIAIMIAISQLGVTVGGMYERVLAALVN